MLQLASNLESTSRLQIGGIAFRKAPSPTFKLKIETSLDANGDVREAAPRPNGLWEDELVASKRVARSDVQVGELLAHGAFGAVYSGVFRGERVAVKKLLPEVQADKARVDAFLAEVKISAALDHPHIVRFIGVAWNSVDDLCVVQEFMNGGDLRSLLDRYVETRHAVGFDREKTTVAMQVCSALAHMHSLSPPVIHSNLKSRNILLNEAMEAKVATFGTSPKRQFRSSESAGTTLWMAPEVLRGEVHDASADMFSFGIVLSELDTLSPPYTQARQHLRDSSWRQLRDADIVEKVSKGSLRVTFSEAGPMALAELGRACTSRDPLQRPTASEALYKLQTILARELA